LGFHRPFTPHPEHEPSVIDTIIQYQNTEQSVNDDPNETLQQTHNTEESISYDPQELTRAQRGQGFPIACVSVAPLSIKNQQLDLSPGGQFSNMCSFSVIFWKMSLAAKTLGPGKPCTLWARVSS
jgi:hypothetical protein